MKPTALAMPVLAALVASPAMAADYKVSRSLQLSAPGTQVWHLIGDFCDIDDWHPAIRDCALKVIDGRLHRVLTTTDGAAITQRRIATEPGLSYTYKLTASPLNIDRYTATFSIEPNDGTRVTWSARFTSDDPAAETAIADLFDTGLAAIEKRLNPD